MSDYNQNFNSINKDKKLTEISQKIKYLYIYGAVSTTLCLVLFGLVFWKLNQINGNNNNQIANSSSAISTFIKNPIEKSLDDFTSTGSITQTGFQIRVRKNLLSTDNHGNCKTPNLPPENNGCYFSLLPYSIGLTQKTSLVTSLRLDGKIGSSSEIQISPIDNDNNLIQDKQKIVVKKSDFGKDVPITFDNNNLSGLKLNFWNKDGDIEINKITFKYFVTDRFKKVGFKLKNQQNEETKINNKFSIWYDVNKNSIFDPEVDRLWQCSENFPGVKNIEVNPESTSYLLRDDECYKNNKPELWLEDESKLSLPEGGSWFIKNDEQQVSFNTGFSEEEKIIEI
jgi:hypothetical protein